MIFLVILILVLIYVNNNEINIFKKESEKSEALERLKQRYIDGEISESKYLEMKKNIK